MEEKNTIRFNLGVPKGKIYTNIYPTLICIYEHTSAHVVSVSLPHIWKAS